MKLDKEKLQVLSKTYGDAFYLLDTSQFRRNCQELLAAFRAIYPKFNIAYSYKTNYTPALVKIIDELGGFAEVVSDMEMEIALRSGVRPEKIIFNGPYKNPSKVRELLLLGGTVNLDSVYELDLVKDLAESYPDHRFNVGIRVNFAINDGVISRFGFAVETQEFQEALALFKTYPNLHLAEMQLHYAARQLDTWRPRADGMLHLLDEYGLQPDHVDLGGGLFGKMTDSLKKQFDTDIPTYEDYAEAAARPFVEHYASMPTDEQPELFIEPGSAVVGDCMFFVSRVIAIKSVRDKQIATLLGSVYNINPTLNKKNPPLEVFLTGTDKHRLYEDLDFGGFTCIESDYVYRNYNGPLAVGDFVVFGNAGSYSITLKPPFILPNFPVLDISGYEPKVIKRQEHFDDLFHTYAF
ncbi:MAG: pyridoxal-dependent decarboxylase [Selenomonas sp.]|jgi:diaminopimelate decarboxylase|nr:pyridoxal-dependent decarboxylase [Selenomonas sp.]